MTEIPCFTPTSNKSTKDNIPLQTICRECVFATKVGKHQYGCEFSRLKRFEKNGGIDNIHYKWVPILDLMENKEIIYPFPLKDQNKFVLCEYENNKIVDFYDDFKEEKDIDLGREHSYYKFNRFCNRSRTIYWADRIKEQNLDLKEQAIHESKLKVTFLIYLGQNDQLFDLENVLLDIEIQTEQPLEVLVVNNGRHDPTDVSNLLESIFGSEIVWKQIILVQKLTKERALDEAYRSINGQYFAQIDLPCRIQKDLAEQLDISINERLDRWFMATFDNPNIKVYQRKLIKMFNGNSGGNWKGREVHNIYDKVVAMIEEYNQSDLIIKL